MKEELIQLAAKEIEGDTEHKLVFKSEFLYNRPMKYSSKEELRWLFWMTELQAWLREQHQIHIAIYHFWDFANNEESYDGGISQINNEVLHEYDHKSFEYCLQYSLIQALNLIKPKE